MFHTLHRRQNVTRLCSWINTSTQPYSIGSSLSAPNGVRISPFLWKGVLVPPRTIPMYMTQQGDGEWTFKWSGDPYGVCVSIRSYHRKTISIPSNTRTLRHPHPLSLYTDLAPKTRTISYPPHPHNYTHHRNTPSILAGSTQLTE